MSHDAAAERDELARRLAEAEATIAALVSGEIDAVVDARSQTPVLLAKAQTALRQERDRAQRYLDTPEVILMALDSDARITLVNRCACSLLGWTADELLGRDWAETCLPERLRNPLRRGFHALLSGGAAGIAENPVITRSGEERLIEWRNTLLHDDSGRVIGTFSCGTDITERRAGELALQQTTADLVERTEALEQHAARLSEQAALLDLAQDAIIVRDMSNRILFWSRGAEAMYGWSSAEAIGRVKSELLQSEYAESADAINATLLRTSQWEGEAIQSRRDGSRVTVATRWTLQRGADGTSIRILTINNDISGRKEAEAERLRLAEELQKYAAALRDNEERTTYALSAAGMGVWDVDLVTQYVSWSETMASIYGLSPAESPTRVDAFLSLLHPDDRDMVTESFQNAVRSGADFVSEFRSLRADGTVRWHSARARVLRDPESGAARVLGIDTDISDRKLLEAQFRQAQKMEAVGQLAGGVAHDFNNLLTAILGYSNFVVDTLEPADPRRADLEEVINAGHRAAALTTQLLAFSRRQVLQPVVVDLNALVVGMRQMLSRLIGEQVDVVARLAPDLGAVRADAGQLEQVLMNLVVNARDAMPTGGRLALETANVDLDGSFTTDTAVQPGSYVMLAVSDSGSGMTEATRQRLFEPFFTTKDVGKGTGLGLATVYGIVKQSGGHIWVYSEPGQGATFKVFLPRVDAEEKVAQPNPGVDARATATETVLVVEDEKAVRSLTCRILQSAGYRVFDAPNPEQAEIVFAGNAQAFDVLVTDVIMPGSTGPKLFARLAQSRPELKVLYVSGYTDDTIVHQGQLDPGVEFLQKPYTAEALKRRVREVLHR